MFSIRIHYIQPYVILLLKFLFLGLGSSTKLQVDSILEYNKMNYTSSVYQMMTELFEKPNSNYTLNRAQKLFFDKSIHLTKSYYDLVKKLIILTIFPYTSYIIYIIF